MNRPAVQSDKEPPFELKGSTFTLSVMHLRRTSIDDIGRELEAKVKQAPGFFRDAPVILDIDSLEDQIEVANFRGIVELVSNNGMVPVGVRGGSEPNRQAAKAAGLAVLPITSIGTSNRNAVPAEREPAAVSTAEPEPTTDRKDEAEHPPEQDQATAVATTTLVIEQPIRSGQQVYSQFGDLIALKTVSAGAELVSNGNIHVLGPLRGRALAGAHGDVNAHIICQSLQAELVSIAGRYRVFEEMEPAVRGRAVHICLKGDRLIIEPL